MVHDGMFDIRSFYYSTDELWFPEHDIGGVPWNQPEAYEEWNPAAPERVSKWNTPQMVIHGGRDYRIDQSQGLGAFTALQRRGIPSKFLYFPNEAHQVFDTRDQITWHHEVLAWIGQWTGTPVAKATETVTAGSSVLNQPHVGRSFHSQQVARPATSCCGVCETANEEDVRASSAPSTPLQTTFHAAQRMSLSRQTVKNLRLQPVAWSHAFKT